MGILLVTPLVEDEVVVGALTIEWSMGYEQYRGHGVTGLLHIGHPDCKSNGCFSIGIAGTTLVPVSPANRGEWKGVLDNLLRKRVKGL